MQFEDFDKKVREAAEHHHPAYDEKAWKNMESLLDKHLPVEKDNRRRIIFFLIIFLLAGTGVYLLATRQNNATTISNSSKQSIEQPAISKEADAIESFDKKETASAAVAVKQQDEKNISNGNEVPVSEPAPLKALSPENIQQLENKKIYRNKPSAPGFISSLKETGNTNEVDNTVSRSKKSKTHKTAPGILNSNNNADAVAMSAADKNSTGATTDVATKNESGNDLSDNQSANQTVEVKQTASDSASIKKEEISQTISENKPANKIPAKRNKSVFAITVSGGPDVSTVGVKSIGKMNCVIGAGLSYSYNRFTLRSGFYAIRKVYTAGPEDYKPPKHYWTNYVDLTKVNANCKVYEIPVTVNYNFVQKDDHAIFGAVGLSSFLMKNETYNYYYKDAAGVDKERSWSTKDNNSMFSVINISAGYEKKLARNLSLTAEPYLKIPLDGIGFGNIQMNSMGVLITMNIKPFLKK